MNTIYFLVLLATSGHAGGLTTIPQPFQSETACQRAGEAWAKTAGFYSYRGYYCLPVTEQPK